MRSHFGTRFELHSYAGDSMVPTPSWCILCCKEFRRLRTDAENTGADVAFQSQFDCNMVSFFGSLFDPPCYGTGTMVNHSFVCAFECIEIRLFDTDAENIGADVAI